VLDEDVRFTAMSRWREAIARSSTADPYVVDARKPYAPMLPIVRKLPEDLIGPLTHHHLAGEP
jgi:hypothetical protein